MGNSDPWIPPPRQLPLIVIALIVPTFLGFALGGTAIGTAVGGLTFATVIVLAARSRDRGAIRFKGDADGQPVLVLALAAVEDVRTANAIAALADRGSEARAQDEFAVLVLAPAESRPLQRWLSDTDEARVGAQQRLAVSLAALATAGCHAEGRVVDGDPRQALEDVAPQYGAESVAVVVAGDPRDELIADLEARADRPVHRIDAGEHDPGRTRRDA